MMSDTGLGMPGGGPALISGSWPSRLYAAGAACTSGAGQHTPDLRYGLDSLLCPDVSVDRASRVEPELLELAKTGPGDQKILSPDHPCSGTPRHYQGMPVIESQLG